MTDVQSATQGADEKNCPGGIMYRKHLNAKRVRELLDYNPETGEFRWRVSRGRGRAGTIAGGKVPSGYVSIRMDKIMCKAHRLAWVWMFGDLVGDLDHRNRNKSDNRIINLRLATHTQTSILGIKGVFRVGSTYRAVIYVDKKSKWLGRYKTPYEAALAYRNAARQSFGEFACLQDIGEVKRLSDLEMSRRASEQQQQLPFINAPSTAPTESVKHENV